MRISHILAVLAILSPSVLFGAGTRVPIKVEVRIPLITEVEGPAQVVLAPGEVTRIRVSVMANVHWVLGIHSPNASAPEVVTLSGLPGGATANTRDVEIRCSPQASGPQTIALIYTLMSQ